MSEDTFFEGLEDISSAGPFNGATAGPGVVSETAPEQPMALEADTSPFAAGLSPGQTAPEAVSGRIVDMMA